MQLFALDDISLVFANVAAKQKNYHCCECGVVVRLRKGLHRQPHFYHLQPTRDCHLSGKGMVHLQTQMHFLSILPQGECALEYRFPSIQRIADVAWIPQQLVFEIQYSSITAEEVAQRNADYGKLGWQVIWILHDHRYNHARLSAAEAFLSGLPHYFTNIDQEGNGIVYDQLSHVEQGMRKYSLRSSSVNVASFKSISSELPLLLQNRTKTWPYYFQGDWVDRWHCATNVEELSYLEQLAAATKPRQPRLWKIILDRLIIRPYRLLFQLLLEKQCR